MRGLLRRLFSESAVYGLGGMTNQALAIILVPIYARQLGAANYGVVAIVNTTLSLAVMAIGLALPQAFFRAYLRDAGSDRERVAVLDTATGLRLVVSTLGLLLFSALSVPLTLLLFGGLDELPILLLIGPTAFFDTLSLVPLSFLRAQRRPGPYMALASVRAVLGTLLIIVFVVGFDLGVLGVILGSAISAAVSASVGFLILLRSSRVRLRWNGPLVRSMLAFSLPLVPAAIAGWALNLSDRYVVQAFEGAAALGAYAAGYTIGLVINALAIQPFSLAWGAAYWEIARQDQAPHVFGRILTVFSVAAGILALGLSAFGTDVVRFFLTPDFEPGRFVVPFSAFAYVLYGVYTIVTTGLNLTSQTRWVPIAIGAAAAGNVALNLVLVPAFGFMGAAYATLASYASLALLGGWFSQRHYPVPWDHLRVGGTLILGLALSLAALLGPDAFAWRALTFAVYLPLLLGLRLVSLAELRAGAAALRRSRR